MKRRSVRLLILIICLAALGAAAYSVAQSETRLDAERSAEKTFDDRARVLDVHVRQRPSFGRAAFRDFFLFWFFGRGRFGCFGRAAAATSATARRDHHRENQCE